MRIASLICAVALMAGTMAQHAAACGLSRWFGGPAATATTFSAAYAPYSVAYRPAVYAAYYPATVGPGWVQPVGVYRAQTYYRVAYPAYSAAYPAVAVQPAVGCSACAATAVTTYRPLGGLAWRLGLAPYAVARVVYANPCPLPAASSCAVCAGPCTSACATAGYGAPSLSTPVSASPASCGCAATTTYYAPPAQTIVPEPSSAYTSEAPAINTSEQPATGGQERKTFQEGSEPQQRLDLKPIPESGPIPQPSFLPETAPVPDAAPVPQATSPTGVWSAPRLIPPEGPTAARGLGATAGRLVPVSFAGTVVPDDSGWRPSYK